MPSSIVYCEMCGRPIEKRLSKIVFIEGAKLVLCPACYAKVGKRSIDAEIREYAPSLKRRLTPQSSVPATRRSVPKRPRDADLDNYEVVSDFAERVRTAREKLGWSQRALAEAVKESENVIKRIESGRLVPSIDLARRLEKVLGIRLLEPIVEPESFFTVQPQQKVRELTLGDIVRIRKKGSEKNE
ncbi:MAG: TIGR00270 family protein [Desulfurococcales archaeon]|nr:TIGR00270 family protein [Desulfurococcales archaeon]